MPAARAASSREDPSSTSARASIRRAARASRHRPASRRSSTAPSSFRVTATVMAPLRRSATPPINALGPRVAPRAQRSEAGAVGMTPMLLPTHDHEHADDELAEGVPTAALMGMLAWLVPALLVLVPVAALAAVSSRPKRADLAFVDPIEAVRVPDGEGAA